MQLLAWHPRQENALGRSSGLGIEGIAQRQLRQEGRGFVGQIGFLEASGPILI